MNAIWIYPRQYGRRANLKTEVTKIQSTPNFPKNERFYPLIHTSSFFGKFGVLSILVTCFEIRPFAILPTISNVQGKNFNMQIIHWAPIYYHIVDQVFLSFWAFILLPDTQIIFSAWRLLLFLLFFCCVVFAIEKKNQAPQSCYSVMFH